MGALQPPYRATLAALVAGSLISCHPRHAPRHWNTSQQEFHFRGPAAIAVVNPTEVSRQADRAWLLVFLEHFDRAADSLERAGYAVAVTLRDTIVVIFPDTIDLPNGTNVGARDTFVVTDGSNVLRLTPPPSPITYYFVAPRRRPLRKTGGETAARLQRIWGLWVARAWDTLPQPALASVPPGASGALAPPDSTPVPLAPCGRGMDSVGSNERLGASGRRGSPEPVLPPGTSAQSNIQPVARAVVLETRPDTDYSGYNAWADRVGVFTSGPYRGYDLVHAAYETTRPCKGRGCPVAQVRFAMRGQDVVYLPKLSSDPAFDPRVFFRGLACHVTTDTVYSDPRLTYPETLTGPEPGQTIEFVEEAWGAFDARTMRKVFRDRALGDVYATHGPYFLVFRPDGSSLAYRYTPPIVHQELRWNGQARTWHVEIGGSAIGWGEIDTTGSYYARVIEPCTDEGDVITDIDPAKELVQIGVVEDRGPVYGYRDPRAAFLRGLYAGALAALAGRVPRRSVSYEAFLATKPVFFWRDPFGRLERFINSRYVAPCEAEPIIYLYPERRQVVDVELNRNGHIVASEPRYERGWQVEADPSGRLVNLADRKRYPHLFWEGWSSLLDTPEQGYVIAAARVGEFFRWALPELGLSSGETNDFVQAWVPRLSGAPYYFITFIPPPEIERLAPLRVTPRPETVIRVLMDYRPLERPVAVHAPELARPPERKGFTVVEWGGLTRR
jgi:hypothetical protein